MSRRRHSGFTLVELLVVIGIIALLISILLPALNKARQQANTVKCAASLKQIGNAFKLYEIDNRGYFPIAVYKTLTPIPAAGEVDQRERRWSDLISKYLHKTASQGADDITKFRESSVLWGCPEYTKSTEYKPTQFADRVRNGYGMQYYPVLPVTTSTDPAKPGNLSYIDFAASPLSIGTWHKGSVWTRKGKGGSANRGLVADSITHIIGTTGTYSRANGGFFNGRLDFSSATNDYTTAVIVPAGAATSVQVDAQRHLKRGRSPEEIRKSNGINMLFCDMSVRAIGPAEAWNSIRGDGVDSTVP